MTVVRCVECGDDHDYIEDEGGIDLEKHEGRCSVCEQESSE